jgi:hypothetical protein
MYTKFRIITEFSRIMTVGHPSKETNDNVIQGRREKKLLAKGIKVSPKYLTNRKKKLLEEKEIEAKGVWMMRVVKEVVGRRQRID